MNRLDGRGHHPKARPTFWANKVKSKRKKLIKISRLSERHLVLMKKGEDLVARKSDRYEEGVSTIRVEALLEPMIVEMDCTDAKTYYIDTNGCGTQLANPANSPPKNGFVRMMMRYAAVLLLSLMMLAWPTACNKQPIPEPQPTPTDSIPETPVTPVKTHDTIYWNWVSGPSFGPHEDTIRDRLLKNPKLRELVIQLHGDDGINRPTDCTNWMAIVWTLAQGELDPKLAIDNRVKLDGIFMINNANITNPWSEEIGTTPENKAWFENNGCKFLLPRAITNGGKPSPLPRAITNGGKRR